ncbi:MAG TPA: zeta toxin family protein [Rhizomicrobium sp.]|jgi:predicted ABC-type ATPase|nr:zeta toxin family protein [Rhizomicrobium sp.]
MSDRPVLVIIAGPNGSGKTTLTRQLEDDGLNFGEYINPDVIAETLDGTYPERVAKAQEIAEVRRQDCIVRRADFSFETVMSHPSKVGLLSQAKEAGYAIVLFFVATESPELNVARVRQRVTFGGHDVPADRIVARYHRTMSLLPAAIALCDRVVLFDNTYRPPRDEDIVLKPLVEMTVTDGKGGAHFALRVRATAPLPRWMSEALSKVAL